MKDIKKRVRSKTPIRKRKKKECKCCIDNYLHIAYLIFLFFLFKVFL